MPRTPFFSSRLRRHPYDVYDAVRADPELHHSPTGLWVATQRDHVRTLLTSSDVSSGGGIGQPGEDPKRALFGRRRHGHGSARADELMRPWLIFADPPAHTRLRRTLGPAIASRVANSVEPRVGVLVAEVVDGLPVGPTVDLVPSFARAISQRVAAALVGIPEDDHEAVGRWSTSVGLALEPFLDRPTSEQVAADLSALGTYVDELVARRAGAPGDDLVSDLLGAVDAGEIERDEVSSLTLLVIAASQETTASLLASAALLLLTHPGDLDEVRAKGTWGEVVEEALRLESPIQMVLRTTVRPMAVGSTDLPTESQVLAVMGAANRDDAAHADPHRFEPGRAGPRNLSFGAGPHTCPGAGLATAETTIGLRTLFERHPAIALDGVPEWSPFVAVRSLRSLPVRLGPS